MARVIFQFARVLLIASHARRAREAQEKSEVSFANVTEMPRDPMNKIYI